MISTVMRYLSTDTFLKILEAYDWEFCQIQYNNLDETSQANKAFRPLPYKAGIGIARMIMSG